MHWDPNALVRMLSFVKSSSSTNQLTHNGEENPDAKCMRT